MGIDSTQPEKDAPSNGQVGVTTKDEPLEAAFTDTSNFEPVDIGGNVSSSSQPNPVVTPSAQFDPAIHCTDENGHPRRNKDGSFRRRPLQDKKPSDPIKPMPDLKPPEPPRSFNDPAPVGTVQMVCMCLDVVNNVMCVAVGPEMRAQPEERQLLTDVWSRYVHYKGWDETVSPEVAVFLATFMFFSPRIPYMINKIKEKRAAKHAHSNHRSTGTGQEHTGQNNSTPSGTGGDRIGSA